MANPVIKNLRGAFAKKPTLEDGQLFIDKTNERVVVGCDSATGGEFTLANNSDLDAIEQDVADIMTDYAKTAGGNEFTESRAIASDANGHLVASETTSDELGFVHGVTSAIQTQLDSKVEEITAKDSSVVVDATNATQPEIGVQISATDNNNLKLNSDGLYSGEEVMVVHLSGTADALVADKTFQQVSQAMKANRVCVAVIDSAIQVTGANISPSTILYSVRIDTNNVSSGYKFSVAQLGLSGQIGLLTAFATSNNVWSVSYSEVVQPLIVTFTEVSGQNYYTASETAENIKAAYISGRPVFAKHPTATFAPYASVNFVASGAIYEISFGFVIVHDSDMTGIYYTEIANTYITPTQWYMLEVRVSGPLVVTFSGTSSFTSSISKDKIYDAWVNGRAVVCKLPQTDEAMGNLVHAKKVGNGINDYDLQFESRVIVDIYAIVPATNYIVRTLSGSSLWSTSIVSSPNMPSGGGGVMSAANNRVTGVSDPESGTDAVNKQSLLSLIYPVGSIYMSVNATTPQTFLGGTWEQIQDTFLLAAGSTYAAGSTGGEATHTLTNAELPNTQPLITATDSSSTQGWYRNACATTSTKNWELRTDCISTFGHTDPHNNMPPYLAVYIWKRTA